MAFSRGGRLGVGLPGPAMPFKPPSDVPLDIRAIREQSQPAPVPPSERPPLPSEFQFLLDQFGENFLATYRDNFLPALERRAYHQLQAINVGTTWVKARPEEPRTYLFIVNNDAVNNLFVAYGQLDGTTGSIAIGPGGFYEPWVCPINDLWIRGSAAGTVGVLSIATSMV
jgi:hypothetical protein